MALELKRLAADARFWDAAARAVVEFAVSHGIGERQLQSVTLIVPGAAHAALTRRALHDALGRAAFVPPRIVPYAEWIGTPRRAAVAARAELFAALRASGWVRDSFGPQPAALWALARGIARLCEELTWAAFGQEDAFERRLQESLARHFHRRAARALQPQSQLVLQLWRVRRGDDDVARALKQLQDRAEAAVAPLVVLSDSQRQPWEDAFLGHYARRAPVLVLQAGIARALQAHPLLAAAWPELGDAAADAPIGSRAARVRADTTPLAIIGADSLEEEAGAVAQQVLDWLRAGVPSIALVALDRLTARRARALLERAQVAVRDEVGWRLSTTSAAAAVMRWLDLVADDLYWRDLLDWLKSPFTLADRPSKAAEVAQIERAIRADGALQGARAMRRALADGGGAELDGARAALRQIEAQASAARNARPTLGAHAQALGAALQALGMRIALAADPVGREVLRELDALERELAQIAAGRASLADFRALLSERLEEVSFVDRQVDSPVAMVSLEATFLRPFGAALLIGADAQHLPAAPADLLFMSNAVRAELGLATADAELRRQAERLAALLVGVPNVVATWRRRHADEVNAISPLLERLQFIAARAAGDDLQRTAASLEVRAEAVEQKRPAPSAPHRLPSSISASAAQSLVNCAYQFYARRLLALVDLEDVIEAPDKRDFGERLHEVLRRFHDEWGAVDFSTVEARALAASLAEHACAVFDPLLERTPGLLAFKRRFEGLIDGYVDWLRQHAAEGWRWQASEQRRSMRWRLDDGREIELVGRLDRIDARARAGEVDVHVIDYKARAADVLSRGLKEAGEDVQLPFYGLLLARRASASYVSFDRAKEGASGVRGVAPPQPFDELVEQVGRRLRVDLQRVADGASLPAIGSDAVCAHCEMRGLCRRDYWEREPANGAMDTR